MEQWAAWFIEAMNEPDPLGLDRLAGHTSLVDPSDRLSTYLLTLGAQDVSQDVEPDPA